MADINPKSLIEKLSQVCHRKLMEAAALCSSRTHYEVQLEHWLLKLLEIEDSDLRALFRHYEIDAGKVRRDLETALNRMKTGSGGAPQLSPDILHPVPAAGGLPSLEYKRPPPPAAVRPTRSSPARPASARPPWLKGWPCASPPATCRSPCVTSSCACSTWACCKRARA